MDKNMSFDASNSASLVILMDEVLDKYLLIPFLIENSEVRLYNSPLALLTSA
jgi:hypothetical protein